MGMFYEKEEATMENLPKNTLKFLQDYPKYSNKKHSLKNASNSLENPLHNTEIINSLIEKSISKNSKLNQTKLNHENHKINKSLISSVENLSDIESKQQYILNLFSESSHNERSTLNSSCLSRSCATEEPEPEYEFKFFNDSNELRNSYYTKLISKNIIPLKKEPTHNSIFIFDWDDTFFFTSSFINEENLNKMLYNNFSKMEKKKIELIEFYVSSILTKALEKGSVFIITNSSEGWVQGSTKIFYPSLVPLLEKINIISARSLYEKKYPKNKDMWKINAFLDIQSTYNFDKNKLTNIICIGDDKNEIEAGKLLNKTFRNSIIKTIKFQEGPKIDELIKQLKLIDTKFNLIYSFSKNVNIKIDKKQKKTSI